jgi:hypothetical protein
MDELTWPIVLRSGTRPQEDGFGYLNVPAAGGCLTDGEWACDNGAYSGFDPAAYVAMLSRVEGQPGCRFVTAPDVVGDWAATEALYRQWQPMISARGFPVAVVLQDGVSVPVVPWDTADALFVGGTTEFKLGTTARTIVAYGRSRGLWCHMGRVNTRRRYRYASAIGCHSVDGSTFSWYARTSADRLRHWKQQPGLPFG